MKIVIEIDVKATLANVWDSWITPEDIRHWNAASDDWCCPKAEINLHVGGRFSYRMEAKDGSMGFDFEGTFTQVSAKKSIHFTLDDERLVFVEFLETVNGVRVVECFEVEDEHSAEQQRQGWQNILNRFKGYVEGKSD